MTKANIFQMFLWSQVLLCSSSLHPVKGCMVGWKTRGLMHTVQESTWACAHFQVRAGLRQQEQMRQGRRWSLWLDCSPGLWGEETSKAQLPTNTHKNYSTQRDSITESWGAFDLQGYRPVSRLSLRYWEQKRNDFKNNRRSFDFMWIVWSGNEVFQTSVLNR